MRKTRRTGICSQQISALKTTAQNAKSASAFVRLINFAIVEDKIRFSDKCVADQQYLQIIKQRRRFGVFSGASAQHLLLERQSLDKR